MAKLLEIAFEESKNVLIKTIQSSRFDSNAVSLLSTNMAHGYDKEKAFFLMSQLNIVKKLIDKLEAPSLPAIASMVNASDTALRTLWEEMTGENWADNRKYEVTIRPISAIGKLKKKHPKTTKES